MYATIYYDHNQQVNILQYNLNTRVVQYDEYNNNSSERQKKTMQAKSKQKTCPIHPQAHLTLYNLTNCKHECPKCVVFSADNSTYQGAQFIDIDGDQALSGIVSNYVNTIDRIFAADIKTRVAKQRDVVRNKLMSSLDTVHLQILKQLNQLKLKEQTRIMNKIQKIQTSQYKQFNEHYQAIFKKFQILKTQYEQANPEQPQLYPMLSQLHVLMTQLPQIQKNYQLSSQIVMNQYRKLSQEHRCGMTVAAFSSIKAMLDKQTRSQNLSLQVPMLLIKKSSEVERHVKRQIMQKEMDEQELLIQGIQEWGCEGISDECTEISLNLSTISKVQQPQISKTFTMKPQKSKINPQKSSITTLNTSRTTIATNGKKNSTNHVLTLTSRIQSKIDSQVRQVVAKNLQMSNLDAKKLLTEISNRSFVKVLDLSNNKITGAFLKQINKNLLGKYLKTIKIGGNPIDTKDAVVAKKIQVIKGWGVNVTL